MSEFHLFVKYVTSLLNQAIGFKHWKNISSIFSAIHILGIIV